MQYVVGSPRKRHDEFPDAAFPQVSEVAKLLKVCVKTIRREIKRDELRIHMIGGQQRISSEDLAAYLARKRR